MSDVITVRITTEYIKLDSFLKLAGVFITGGEAKEAIMQGSVIVNDETCLIRGKKLRHSDIIKCKDFIYEVIQNDN